MINQDLFGKEYQFIRAMEKSENYIRMTELKHNYSYQIFARHAYAGVWDQNKEKFLVSRYKVGPQSYVSYEYHWDYKYHWDDWGELRGTVKPLKLIEKCPFLIDHIDSIFDPKNSKVLDYLDALEEANPVIPGYNTLQKRRQAAIKFAAKLSGDHYSNEQLLQMIKENHRDKEVAIKLLKKRGIDP